MMAIAGESVHFSLLVFILFLWSSLVSSSTGSSNGRFPSSSPPPASSNIPRWKEQLPFPLNNKTKTLQRILMPSNTGSDVEVFLLGTAHVSKDSSRDVRQLLEAVEPDAIFLELCHQRLDLLFPGDKNDIDADLQQEETFNEELTSNSNSTGGFWNQCRSLLRRGQNPRTNSRTKKEKRIDIRSFSSIASSLLVNIQGENADSLGVELGGEFHAAYEYWKEDDPRYPSRTRMNNVCMILGDRPFTLTLTRAWESLRIWGKIKLIVGLLVSSLRKPNPEELRAWMENILNGDTDLMSESVAELAKHFPTLAEVILKERDAYMACKLHQTCRKLLSVGIYNRYKQRYRVVAIVGAGHVEGICRWLTTGDSLTKATTDLSHNPAESPEDILSKLIQIKASISELDHGYLVNEITELDPQLFSLDDTIDRKMN